MSLIPPRLHYCWFGPRPEPHPDFRVGWRRLHPGYEILRWDASNAPVEHPYLAAVLARRLYSKAADFMRLWLMIHHGGIYLDVDIECLRSLEPLRDRALFAGFQREPGFDPDSLRGRLVAAHLARSSCSTSSVSARVMIASRSASGWLWRIRSCARRSVSYVSRETVNWTL